MREFEDNALLLWQGIIFLKIFDKILSFLLAVWYNALLSKI